MKETAMAIGTETVPRNAMSAKPMKISMLGTWNGT